MPKYLLFINQPPVPLLKELNRVQSIKGYEGLQSLVLTQTPEKYTDNPELAVVACTFATEQEIKTALAPYIDNIVGVFCKGEGNIQYLRRTIPVLPPHLHVATPKALSDSTNKRAMREAFAAYNPVITPQFIKVGDAKKQTVDKIETAVPYPVIIKPASLASSMLIRVCRNREELAQGLSETFDAIATVYAHEKRDITPEVVVEEYLEGDLYSTDVYILDASEMYFCPPVYYMSNRERGMDDFSLYKRVIPTQLTDDQIAAMNQTAADAINALGLTYSTAHVELILTKNGWRIIELGPRIGRYRHNMYGYAYGIDHYFNDVLIHLGKKPSVPTTFLRYCAAYSIYPEKEGRLRKITGLDYLQNNPVVPRCSVRAEVGDECKFAKNGGKLVAEFYIVSEDKQRFDEAVAYVEANVRAVTD